MCFTKLFRSNNQAQLFLDNPKVATEDIPVWKNLLKLTEVRGQSPYYEMRYYKGFEHYITNKDVFGKDLYKSFTKWSISIDRGLHSYKRLNVKRSMVQMYIPKGALYYENRDEYVSSALVWY